ncbi:MAG: CopD family protein [Gammaproteobacteria bacterium]
MYLWFKIFHIFFMFAWFAGIFYLPRLFVYFIESNNQATKDTLTLMQRKLFRFTFPMGLLAAGMGLYLVSSLGGLDYLLTQRWIMLKLSLTLSLLIYHLYCWKLITDLESNKSTWTSKQMRIFNELPVILLLMILISAVLKF